MVQGSISNGASKSEKIVLCLFMFILPRNRLKKVMSLIIITLDNSVLFAANHLVKSLLCIECF